LVTRAVLTDRDPDELLREAQQVAYRLPAGFGGFTARLSCATGEAHATRTVRVGGPGDVVVRFDSEVSEELRQAAQRELASMVGHRWAQAYEDGDGRYSKRLGPEDGPLAGRLVILEGDPFASSYRVADGQVAQVNRTMGASRFSIVIHARTAAPGGRFLPQQFSVYHWAADSGQFLRADSFSDTYVEVAGVLLPASRTVVTADGSGLGRREIRLAGHELLAGARP
jgi:hypothetical protein